MNIMSEYESSFTPVPNSFIENFMGKANPSYICVYILTLKYITSSEAFSTEMIADKLDIFESDVIKAYEYWNENGEIEFTKSNEEYIIRIIKHTSEDNNSKPTYNSKEISRLIKSDENIARLLDMGERALAQGFDENWKNVIIRLYKYYKLPDEVIVVLFEHCIKKDKKMPKYVEAIAQDWSKHNIKTEEKAYEHLRKFSTEKRCSKVISFFGARSDTIFSLDEKDTINKWFDEYEFDDHIIKEACQMTVEKFKEVSVKYTDGTLQRWYNAGVKTLQDALEEKKKFFEKNNKKYPNKSEKQPYKLKSSSFSNFQQRSYDDLDLEALENEIIKEK